MGLERACDLHPTKPQLDEEHGRHEQRAEDHPEEQVEPPSGAQTEPERGEGPPVEKASREPHGQDRHHQAGYAADEREHGGIGDDQGIESAG